MDVGSIAALKPGATRPGVLDVLTALILLAILVWAAWKQFPTYRRRVPSTAPAATATLSNHAGAKNQMVLGRLL